MTLASTTAPLLFSLVADFPRDNDDQFFDYVDDLVDAFASSPHAEDADLTFVSCFVEAAHDRGTTSLFALTKAEVVPMTIDLLRECDGDEEELIETLAALWTWLGGEGATAAGEVIESLLDLDPSALPRVHAFRKKKVAAE